MSKTLSFVLTALFVLLVILSSSNCVRNRQKRNAGSIHKPRNVKPNLRLNNPNPNQQLPGMIRYFQDQTLETSTPISLKIEGKIPTWVKGTLLKNGFGTRKVRDNFEFGHMFDGFAKLYKFEIVQNQAGTEVLFSTKFIQSEVRKSVLSTGKYPARSFGGPVDPCVTLLGKFATMMSVGDNTNVNVWEVAPNKFLAVGDIPSAVEVDIADLETVGDVSFKDRLETMLTKMSCAHPQYDKDHNTINYLARFTSLPLTNNHYVIYKIDPKAPHIRQELLAVPTDNLAFMHSFALTENYMVLTEWPNYYDLLKVMNPNSYVLNFLEFHKSKPAKFYVVNMKTFELEKVYYTDGSAFAFHHINAFEKGGDIHFDAIVYDDPSIVNAFYEEFITQVATGEKEFPCGKIRRYTLPLSQPASKLRSTDVNDDNAVCIEMPRINDGMHMKDYTFVYGVKFIDNGMMISKVNVKDTTTTFWRVDGHFASEPIFIPTPVDASGPRSEDDGVVLSIVFNSVDNTSYLLVLDAKTMKPIAKATAVDQEHKGTHIPFTFHGGFFDGGL